MTDATLPSTTELVAHEQTIERGMKSFVEVGQALAAIRDGKLYRDQHKTFESYCEERWGWKSSRARQLIGASGIFERLKSVTTVTLPTERHIRPLTKLKDPDQQRQAWQKAVSQAPEGRVTAKHVEEVVNTMRTPKTKPRLKPAKKPDPKKQPPIIHQPKPIRNGGRPVELPNNPQIVAATLMSLFDETFIRQVITELESKLKGN